MEWYSKGAFLATSNTNSSREIQGKYYPPPILWDCESKITVHTVPYGRIHVRVEYRPIVSSDHCTEDLYERKPENVSGGGELAMMGISIF